MHIELQYKLLKPPRKPVSPFFLSNLPHHNLAKPMQQRGFAAVCHVRQMTSPTRPIACTAVGSICNCTWHTLLVPSDHLLKTQCKEPPPIFLHANASPGFYTSKESWLIMSIIICILQFHAEQRFLSPVKDGKGWSRTLQLNTHAADLSLTAKSLLQMDSSHSQLSRSALSCTSLKQLSRFGSVWLAFAGLLKDHFLTAHSLSPTKAKWADSSSPSKSSSKWCHRTWALSVQPDWCLPITCNSATGCHICHTNLYIHKS